ncbi:MAG TPA: D-2-hydroxyacid dehydrogenase [Herpetosiphonaceae bacterium]|nr:D-2-hydroxyacid dehydrogenase [Herpetosiphonaceae bacterium]
MVRIVVGDEIAGEVKARLGATTTQARILEVDQDGRGASLSEADGVLRWGLSGAGLRHVLETAPGLRWLHSVSAGVEHLPLDDLRRRDIVVTNAAGIFAIPIAEWVMMAMLMIAKRAHAMHDAQLGRRWSNDLRLAELMDKSVLVLGAGGIGQEIARRAVAFGMHVWGANRSGRPVEPFERIVAGDEWRELLPDADFVVVALPLTAATRSLIGAPELGRMKGGAALLNVGRGATVDEAALLDALRSGVLGAAAIDAWTEEPLLPDHPAWQTPNLLIWPHHSGDSPENTRRGLDLFVQNLERFEQDRELINVVDLAAGY